ncbi:MAG: hypothetical protein LBH06_07430 [Rikenellaceae bacterium]|nr:hypothetical protein [Rikenellaceae bacterium]
MNKRFRPKYRYSPRGRIWVVSRWTYDECGGWGDKVSEWPTKEQAKAEACRLNGWKYKKKAGL